MAEPPAKKPRFASVTEDALEEIQTNRVAKSTRMSTEKWMKVVFEYLREKRIACDFRTVAKNELGKLLRRLYVELRQKDGNHYSRSSLLSCRAAVQRYLNQNLKRDVNIYKDAAFKAANATLDGHLKQLKREGCLQPTEHKAALSSADFRKVIDYFERPSTQPNPIRLTEQVWFYLSYHFCLRGREMQALLRREDLKTKTDAQGHSYIVLSTAFATKTYQGGTSGSDEVSVGRIQQRNQVEAVQLLLSKLHPSSSRLFQMAKKTISKDDEVWYTGQPLGKNTLSLMMRRISEKAELSRVYTNHSVRASCITKLADSGVPDSLIMATSGHKRAESIKTYNRPTEIQVRRAAVILDDETDSSMDAIDSALAMATPHQLGELEQPNTRLQLPERVVPIHAMPAASASSSALNFSGAVFTGCTVNLSFGHQFPSPPQ